MFSVVFGLLMQAQVIIMHKVEQPILRNSEKRHDVFSLEWPGIGIILVSTDFPGGIELQPMQMLLTEVTSCWGGNTSMWTICDYRWDLTQLPYKKLIPHRNKMLSGGKVVSDRNSTAERRSLLQNGFQSAWALFAFAHVTCEDSY